MIILTAGHTGAGTGAQCVTTQFDEGSETIWLRNRVAEILTNKYGLVVLMDNDTASLKLLTKALTEDLSHTDILHTDNILHTERTENTEDTVAAPAEDRLINDFEQSEKSKFRELRGFRERTNNSVRNNNSAGVKSVEICRATLAQQESESLNPDGKKSSQSVLSVGDKKSRSEKKSVHSVGSVREKNNSVRNTNSVRISSTRGINISRHETDTTSTLRITLRPDTVFVPYTNHIRSDTIVVPDRVCQQKLNRSNMTNLFLILILIAIIIYSLRSRR